MTAKDTPKIILLTGGALLAVYAFFRATPAIVERQIEKAKEKQQTKKAKAAAAEVTAALTKSYQVCKTIRGVKKCETVNLDTLAKIINDSFKSNLFVEDEQRAIAALQKLPTTPIKSQKTGKFNNLVKELSLVYAMKYKRNLKEDFIKYLSASEFRQVQNWFNFT
jgi:ribosomal protein L22